jgi:hypothetical protein
VSERELIPEDEPGFPDVAEVIAPAPASAAAEPVAESPPGAAPAATPAEALPAPPPPPPEPAAVGPARPLSPTRAVALYLTQLRQLLAEATESRRAWVRQIGIMMQDARTRPMAMVSPTAGKIGAEQLTRFGEMRERLGKLEPPPSCDELQTLLHVWIERHMEVCQILVEFGRTGDLARLRASQGLLAEGRADLQRFQAEYTRRVAALRHKVDAAKKRRRPKWPFGGSRAS